MRYLILFMLLCGVAYAEDDITFIFTDTGTTTVVDLDDIKMTFGEVEATIIE